MVTLHWTHVGRSSAWVRIVVLSRGCSELATWAFELASEQRLGNGTAKEVVNRLVEGMETLVVAGFLRTNAILSSRIV